MKPNLASVSRNDGTHGLPGGASPPGTPENDQRAPEVDVASIGNNALAALRDEVGSCSEAAPFSSMAAAGKAYVQIGWPIFPVHTKNGTGCTCRHADCSNPAKHPRTKHGVLDATIDLAVIQRWQREFRYLNWGLAAGSKSGVFITDIDPRHDGHKSWEALEAQHGRAPKTVEAKTPGSGGRGRHLFWRYPDGIEIRNREGGKGGMPVGLDVRGEGGYVILAPSTHIEGRQYEWVEGQSPHDMEPAEPPAWLLDLVRVKRETPPKTRSREQDASDIDLLMQAATTYIAKAGGQGEGQRNSSAFSVAGHLKAFIVEDTGARLTEAQILDLVRGWNHRNNPPLQDAELTKAVKSAFNGNGKPRNDKVVKRRSHNLTPAPTKPPEDYEPDGPRPPKDDIDAADQNLERVTTSAWRAIERRNEPPYIYLFGGYPARIQRVDDGNDSYLPVVRYLDLDGLRHVAAREILWWRDKPVGKEVERVDAMPPKDVIKDMLATPEPPLPVLRRTVEAPVAAADGTVLTTPGYHRSNKTLYWPAEGFGVPLVPEQPDHGDVDYARDLITEDLLHDFPFVDESDKATAVAIAIAPFARDLIRGPTPLHLIEKPCHGTGATLMVDVLTYPALGRPIGVMTAAENDGEWRKRITATLMSSPAIVLIDNLRETLDSASLSAALTAEYHEDRELGYSRKLRLPVRCIWIATGNNPAVSGEISRRVVACRLDAKRDQPWLREASGFRHPNLKAWARENRGLLVWAALTLVRAWITAGRPSGRVTLGMFEEWAAVIGGILEVAGVKGFLARESLNRFYQRADKDGEAWRSFAAVWWEAYRDEPKQVGELYGLVGEADLRLGDKGDQSRKIRLGKLLGQMEDRVYNIEVGEGRLHVRIERGEKVHRAVEWRLQQVW